MDHLSEASLRRLRAFLTVAGTLHIGRAAKALGIAQPALSQQIRALEAGIGVRLFNRRKRGIDLTVAGAAYRDEAERLLALHGAAIERARRTARGELGRLAIGYVGSAMVEAGFPAMLRRLREVQPDADLTLREGSITSLLAALAEDALDLALLRAPVELPAPMTRLVASSQRMMVALPPGHRLSKRGALDLAELAAEPMVGFNDPPEVGIMRVVAERARAGGYDLDIAWRVAEVTSVLGLVAAGLGYGVVPEGPARATGPVTLHPLAGAAAAELWYVWHADRPTPALQQALTTIRAALVDEKSMRP